MTSLNEGESEMIISARVRVIRAQGGWINTPWHYLPNESPNDENLQSDIICLKVFV